MTDAALLADALEALAAGRLPEPAALAELRKLVESRPAVAREARRRVGAAIYQDLVASGFSSREAALATRRRLLALGYLPQEVPHPQTIRQRWGPLGSSPPVEAIPRDERG
ncbi:MAG: hypothetical protein QM704_25435 [Anaeromyxobacteraceae bacterium]